MISWEQNTLWITSLSTWEGISFLDYEAAYRAMVEKRMCHDWVKVVDLSQFVSSKTDLSTLKASKTRKRIADLNWWNGLDDADRDMITKAAAETVTLQRNLAAEANGSTLDELAAKGLAINELPAEDRARMGETMNGAIEADIRAKVGNEFYDRFMAELQN